MLAVVLVPLSLLVIACLMERLEARVAPTATVRLAPRRAVGAPDPDATTTPARRQHLRALPTLSGSDPAVDAEGDAGEGSLRRAS